MTNKWVSSLAAGFIAVAGIVHAAPMQAQANLTPQQADSILDGYYQVLSKTLDEINGEEIRPLRQLAPGDVCYTLFNIFNPTAQPNTPFELTGNFFVPAVLSVGGGISTADGKTYQMNGNDFFETPEDFWLSERNWRADDVITVGCYDDQLQALEEGRALNQWQAEAFIQNGIEKLSRAIKYGQPGRAPQP